MTVKKLTKAQASNMWTELRSHFVNAEEAIAAIIESKAWEPLGYSSFAAAWAERMDGVPLATDAARAHVVYALFDCGLTDQQALEATGIGSRVGPAAIKRLREQKESGVSADLATTRVRSHYRGRPTAPRTVHVPLSAGEYSEFRDAAAEQELDTGSLAALIIREYLNKAMVA